MIKLKYTLHTRRTSERKNGYASVIFNIHYHNTLNRLYSGISVMDAQWNEQKERVKWKSRACLTPEGKWR